MQQPQRVLVVDDEEVMRIMAQESLEPAGFEVLLVESGVKAVERFEELKPDIVLLDVQMPYMDGFTTCRELRASALGSHTPILMMTAMDDVQSVKRSYEVGATDFVVKPINWLILRHRIGYVLRANRAAEELRKSRGRLANAQRIARLGYWEWSVKDDRLVCSREMCRILGVRPQALTGTLQDLISRVHSEDQALVAGYFKDLLGSAEPTALEYRLIASDGDERHVEQQTEVAARDGLRATFVTATVRDLSEKKADEATIRFLAYYDALTGLPNRRSFLERLSLWTAERSTSGAQAAVLFLGLDRFGRVNDTLGPSAGDQLLRLVANRLLQCTRTTKPAKINGSTSEIGNFVSRFGGDEFTILLPNISDTQEAAGVASRILDSLNDPFQLDSHEVFVGGSLGIAISPNDSTGAEELVGRSQAARHHARARHGNSYQFYDESINASALERLKLESELNLALKRGELEVFYQPQVELSSGRVLGIEALVRWNHPQRGLLRPVDFLEVAEETGLILPIGEWVLRTACAQAGAWRAEGHPTVRLAVNLSSRQLLKENLADVVSEILQDTEMPPELLDLELTEGALMQDFAEATDCLWRLKSLGVRLSVDDFGTGYSSLNRLARFPLDSLKIDRSFLKGVPGETDMEGIVSAIIAMADSLGLEVIAEGVEAEAQIDFLVARGCTRCQGFLFCKPLSAEETSAFFNTAGAGTSGGRAEKAPPKPVPAKSMAVASC